MARGLRYLNADGAVTASTFIRSGQQRTVVAHRDPQVTAEGFSDPRDRDAYVAMLEEFGTRAETVFGALGSELGSTASVARVAWQAMRTLKARGVELLARDGLSSGRGYLRRTFAGWEVDALWTPWLLHAGLSPDSATGGIMLPVFAGALHQFGLPIVAGGASGFVAAFESLLRDSGVDVPAGVEAERIHVAAGRVRGVSTSRGRIAADEVLASVSPQALYSTLLSEADGSTPPVIRAQAQAAAHYRAGRGAIQLHMAMNGSVAWSDERLREVPLIHLSDGAGSTGIAVAQAEAGLLPNEPTVVVGQQSILDPSRAPDGKSTLWLQLQEAPFEPRGDAAGTIDVAGGWADSAVREQYLDRVIDRIETFAPGFRSNILATDFIAPPDLLAANPNAVSGDPYGGSAEIDQNLRWRPFPEGGVTERLCAVSGTSVQRHIRAPVHWISGREGHDVSTIPPHRLIGPAVVLDIRDRVTENPDFLLDVADIQAWEAEHGSLPENGWLLVRSGWDVFANDQDAFLNADETGSHTPGITAEAAEWLATQTPLSGFGVETVGIDAGRGAELTPPFPAHYHLLGNDKYGITSLQNLGDVPVTGAVLIVAPLPIVGGSGSPTRVFALVQGE